MIEYPPPPLEIAIIVAWNDDGEVAVGTADRHREVMDAIQNHLHLRTAIIDLELPMPQLIQLKVAVPPAAVGGGVADAMLELRAAPRRTPSPRRTLEPPGHDDGDETR